MTSPASTSQRVQSVYIYYDTAASEGRGWKTKRRGRTLRAFTYSHFRSKTYTKAWSRKAQIVWRDWLNVQGMMNVRNRGNVGGHASAGTRLQGILQACRSLTCFLDLFLCQRLGAAQEETSVCLSDAACGLPLLNLAVCKPSPRWRVPPLPWLPHPMVQIEQYTAWMKRVQ